jgi:pimeloyl-ACP methyl ester carboxylesterase
MLETGKGRPVLFLHGGGTEAATYTHLISELAKKFHVYAPDIPFFGKSGTPETALSFEDYGRLFTNMLEKLDLNNVIVLGYSFGGGIATWMHGGTRIKHVILCSPTIQNLHTNTIYLTGSIIKEFTFSALLLSDMDEFRIFLRVIYDFVRNIVKCKKKTLLMPSVISNLNREFSIRNIQNISLVVSDTDPIFPFTEYLKLADQKQIHMVKGAHLWFVLKRNGFETVRSILNAESAQ